MRKDFVNDVSRFLEIRRSDLVEKDLILHQLLLDMSKNKFFFDNFLFKGGTCLIKHYLKYFRFSEDIDFTWKNQKIFNRMSQKEVRRYLYGVIDKLGELFEAISADRGFDFKFMKNNRRYIELGGGNKTATFKIWYESEVSGQESFVKIQINFVDKLYFKPMKGKLKSLLSGTDSKELKFLFPGHVEYFDPVILNLYDIREIFCEKIRSILTRRGMKARDFLDVYLISKEFGIKPKNLEGIIIDKTEFMLKFYEKFRDNFAAKKRIFNSKEIFKWGQERGLLILDIDEEDFYVFVKDFTEFLRQVAGKIKSHY